MRKLGFAPEGTPITNQAQEAYPKLFEQPLPAEHLVAISDLFPVTEALSDDELAVALLQVSEQAY